MKHVSPHALGSFVCLVCSGFLIGVYLVASTQDLRYVWLGLLVFICWPTAAFSLFLGMMLGIVGLVRDKDWQFRFQAVLCGMMCGGCLYWLLNRTVTR